MMAAIRLVILGAQAAPIQLSSVGPHPLASLKGAHSGDPSPAQLSESFGRVPLIFERADSEDGGFFCRGPGYQMWLSPTQALLTLKPARSADCEAGSEQPASPGRQLPAARPAGGGPEAAPLRIRLVGANAGARAVGLEPLPTKVNYFLGNDPGRWRTGVPTFGRVRCQSVYPGVDLVYYGNQRQLEYDFVIAQGADADRIALQFEGIEKMEIDSGGELILRTANGDLRQRRPVVYQELNGRRKEISGRYVLRNKGNRTVGFAVAAYDHSRPLIIDPVLVYSTFLGGLDFDRVWDIAVDSSGGVYVVGDTASTNFPTSSAVSSTNGGGFSDVFLAKLGPAGTNLIFSTYLGGSGADAGFGVALDGSGNIYLTGLTASTNFPVTTNAVSTRLNSAAYFGFYTNDAFVAKLDSTGANLLYSTYLGGSGADEGIAIAVDGSGGVYVAGDTLSADFPTNAVSPPFGGVRDAFVVKLTAAGTNLVYSTYLGGSGDDRAQGIAVDTQGDAIISGFTTSLDFPVTNALQTNFAGGVYDAFVTKLSPDGSTRLFSTYLGGSGDDEALRVVLDNAGNAFFTGMTTSTNFPTKAARYSTNSGLEDAFVVKLDPTGTNLVYSTYLGGVSNDEGWSIAVDTNGNAYVVGLTASPDFPITNAFQSALAGFNDAFVVELDATGTNLIYSTYLGGSGTDNGYGIALDSAGNAYVAGATGSGDFPLYPATNGLQTVYGGGTEDGFVARLFPRGAELRAQRSGPGDVMILWPYGLPDFELQSTDILEGTNTNWMPVTNTPTVTGNDNAITFSNVTGKMFFRLRRTR